MGCPQDGPFFLPLFSSFSRTSTAVQLLSISTKLLELCFKEKTSYTFYKSSNYTILKRAVETKEMCPSQAPGTMESAYGCKHGWQPTLRVTFISHFDKDMGALMDGTFQRKNNTSMALEIHYWIKGGGRQQSDSHRLVAQLCILEGCKSPLFHEKGAPQKRAGHSNVWFCFHCEVVA